MSESSRPSAEPGGDFDVSSVWFTEREAAIARLAESFRTRTGIEYGDLADEVHRLTAAVDGPITRKEANQVRRHFRRKTILAGATLLYAAYGYYDPEELDEVLEDATETATGLVADERAVIPPTAAIRGQDTCPNCGHDVK